MKSEKDLFPIIDDLIASNPIILFMKGNKESPRCGFSAAVVRILQEYEVNFLDIDVLENLALRDAIKLYSKWPTIPQLYVDRKFIGGCDITMELHKSGELSTILHI